MGKQITYEYIKEGATATSIIRRQTWKVWDYGDTIVYGQPGGKMTAYHFVDRGETSEVLEEAPIGWCPPTGPALVYEMEVGLTQEENTVAIGDYLRMQKDTDVRPSVTVAAAHAVTAPALRQQQPRNPRHTNQFKNKSQVERQQHSIPLNLHVNKQKKKANSQALASIPLCG